MNKLFAITLAIACLLAVVSATGYGYNHHKRYYRSCRPCYHNYQRCGHDFKNVCRSQYGLYGPQKFCYKVKKFFCYGYVHKFPKRFH